MGVRLNKVLTELNIGLQTAVEYLQKKNSLGEIRDDANVNTKINDEQYEALVKEFKSNKEAKPQAGMIFPKKKKENSKKGPKQRPEVEEIKGEPRQFFTPLGRIDLSQVGKPATKKDSVPNLNVVGKIDLNQLNKPTKDNNNGQLYNSNLKQKEHLCEALEELGSNDDILYAYSQLENIRKQYQCIGPVNIEQRDYIRLRFKAASTAIEKRYKDYQDKNNHQSHSNGRNNTIVNISSKQDTINKEFNYDVFISYSRKDLSIADMICKSLDKANISYFIDRQGIGVNHPFKVIANAIKQCKIVLFLGSKNSYASKYASKEINYAIKHKDEESILPYMIDDAEIPDELDLLLSDINQYNILTHPIEDIIIPNIQRTIIKKRK